MKKFLSVLLMTLLLFSAVAPAGMAVDFSADLNVSGPIPELVAGKDGTIKFQLKNVSLFAGYDITMSIKTTEKLFTTGTIVNRIDIGTMVSESTKELSIPVKVFDAVKSGYYNVSLDFVCKDRTGTAYTLSETITLHISGEDKVDPKAPDLRISSANLDKNSPGADNLVNLTVGVTNAGKGAASNVKVVLTGLTSDGLSLYKDYSDKVIGKLAPSAAGSVQFPLYVGSAVTTGNQAVKATLEYLDQNGEKKTLETSFFVYINKPKKEEEKPDDGKTPIPRVIIGKYSLDTETVNAGKPFNLTFSLKNTSASQTVKNMAVSLTAADGVFLPVAGTSSFYIKSIAPGGSYEMSIDLTPKRDCETKSYPISVHVEYEGDKSTPYTVDQAISVPVNQEQKLELGQINCFPNGVGIPSNIGFQYYNKGKAILYNTTVKLEGPFTFENGDIFIGNVAASSSDSLDEMIIPSEAGDVKGTVVVEYEDANGNLKSFKQEFSVLVPEDAPVIDPMPEDPGAMDPGMDGASQGFPLWAYIAIGVGSAAVIAVVVLVIVKKKKKAKELVDDE